MKNPLNRRLFRELKDEWGKYLVIFLFMTLTIGFVSGFLVAGDSMMKAYDESFEKYQIEDGHFILNRNFLSLGITLLFHIHKGIIGCRQALDFLAFRYFFWYNTY